METLTITTNIQYNFKQKQDSSLNAKQKVFKVYLAFNLIFHFQILTKQ